MGLKCGQAPRVFQKLLLTAPPVPCESFIHLPSNPRGLLCFGLRENSTSVLLSSVWNLVSVLPTTHTNSSFLLFPPPLRKICCELHKVSYSQPLLSPDPNSLPFRNVLISNLSQNIIVFPCSAQHALAFAFSRDISLSFSSLPCKGFPQF